MFRITQTALTLLVLTTLAGCVVAIGNDMEHDEDQWETRQERNDRYIRALQLGQSQSMVESELGRPDFSESFRRDGDEYQVLYYRTQRMHGDGRTSKDETTPLVFVDEVLVGWGESAIDRATR
ncbi:MAG: DUF3192 domain-containing protein [Proteobacteria bacterium]|jgi:hypothetical protein|nr:DUF3192 domain-containing protein [Pseudomonadota bacterium]MDA1299480.1 DUF3192 domain-containing protein [Pseudomonadota bacterium]